MSANGLKLAKAPIIEAVLDVECDMPPGLDVATLEKPARGAFASHYSKTRAVFVQTHAIETKADQPPQMSVKRGIQAFQFLHEDEKQLVQVRAQGFSFNRLAPYSTLDDYLPEIERTWNLFVSFAAPVQIRAVRLRYINRILLPATDPKLDLERYLKVGPRLPLGGNLTFIGFLNQHTALESDTGNQVNTVLATQLPEGDVLPLIFDITVESAGPAEVQNWAWLLGRIQSLRALKNSVFANTLTQQCLSLFQQQ